MQRARVANTTLLTGARADHSKSLLIRPGPSARQVVNVPSGKQRHPAGLFVPLKNTQNVKRTVI